MYRATTPTHTFELPFDYSQFVSKLLLTYKQNGNIVLEKTEKDITFNGNIVEVELTQEETNLFNGDEIVKIQLRVLTLGNEALASEEFTIMANEVLNDKVL